MLTPVDFVRQRAAMIDQWGRRDPHLLNENVGFLADVTGLDPGQLHNDGQWMCEQQRNMLIASDIYLFTPELADCARAAMAQLEPEDFLDLDPLPTGAVFGFTEPIVHPSGTGSRLSSVMLPMPRLAFSSSAHPDRILHTSMLSYTLRSGMLAHVRSQIDAGIDVEHYRKAEAALRERTAPWRLVGLELAHHAETQETWGKLLRAAITFARSPGIAQSTRAPIPRNVARASARLHAELPDSGVQVIDLRRRTTTRYSDDGAPSSGRTLTQRVFVRGHWRRQACGPNHSERRLTWIDQHLRGPEGADIKGVHRVYFGHGPR